MTQAPNSASTSAAKAATAPKSSAEPIPSRAHRTFYSPENKLVAEGEVYVWTRDEEEGQPNSVYPWANLRPMDTTLAAELEAEYKKFRATKLDRIKSEGAKARLLRLLEKE